MKHLFLKFTYAVEIGARLAYLGHYRATKDPKVLAIADEELLHREKVAKILACYGQKPLPAFNVAFTVIGTFIQYACHVSPLFMLNLVARSMEIFAVVSYNRLAEIYPFHEDELCAMADAEAKHAAYFWEKR
jgi:rubrerythrin